MNGSSGERNLPHHPVLYQQIIQAIRPQRGGKYIDGTLGAAGHATGILELSSPDGELLGLDIDPQALEIAAQRLAPFSERAVIRQASYTSMRRQMESLGWDQVDGIILDLGASSMQFDTPERGFSFLHDGPLDMRFDPGAVLSAAEVINGWDEDALADLIFKYGEERRSRQIAREICGSRPVETTQQLAEIIERTVRREPGSRIHPATRTFQALRIYVNQELEKISQALPEAIDLLAPGGRLAVIAFHSLEDRIVKQTFREFGKALRDENHPMAPEIRPPVVRIITKKPLSPDEKEISENPRARSAKLRVVEKL
jgi:16S rRNA (cytosine1402-N4)-methyltransferase